ncbi:zinc ABC transporter substrate-binding protein [bacterium]|nr:zinc ABC transporter substrate-binding protein [bacterium]
MKKIIITKLCLIVLIFFTTTWSKIEAGNNRHIVVTTSMLKCAAAEIVNHSSGDIEIVMILPPGACPGHFDLKPDILLKMRRAATVIRHGYQAELENKLKQLGADKVKLITVETPGSLVIPDNYEKLIDQITDVLCREYPDKKQELVNNKQTSLNKIKKIKKEIMEECYLWKDQPVIAAFHQKQFAVYLGLEVVGVLKRAEEMTPLDLKKLMRTKAAMIIGNYQSGAESAKALSKRMNLPVAILSNFPDTQGYGQGYEKLVRGNIEKINQAWKKK